MKVSRFIFALSIFVFFLMFSYLFCYVEPDQGGLFTKIVQSGLVGQEKSQVTYELREQGATESLVFNINGMVQFTKLVVKNSYSKPVVLKIYSPVSQDTSKVTPVFQAVADEFKNQVIFAGLNVSQNMDIFMQISMFYRLKQVELPLFLFYKDGQILMPFLAGFQPQNYLSGYIQRKFFAHDDAWDATQAGEISLKE